MLPRSNRSGKNLPPIIDFLAGKYEADFGDRLRQPSSVSRETFFQSPATACSAPSFNSRAGACLIAVASVRTFVWCWR